VDTIPSNREPEKVNMSSENEGEVPRKSDLDRRTNQPQIRPAKPAEAGFLSDLAYRSKAHWGYSPEFMESCREELAVSRSDLEKKAFHYGVAEVNGTTVGYYGLEQLSPSVWELEALFVEPEQIGQGYGQLLIEHAKNTALKAGAKHLLILSDPNAIDFYRASGGEQVGERESASIPGRFLPLLIIQLRPEKSVSS